MPSDPLPAPQLIGRTEEIRRLDALIGAAARGDGGVLVLRGEPGIGKTALLDHARAVAAGFRVIEATGSEFESDLPFAAAHQVCAPVLDQLPDLAAPQRAAVEVAFGLATGTPDPFRIGLGILDLLTSVAAARPVLCVIDDAQWLDDPSARALSFVARRAASEPIAFVVVARSGGPPSGFDELPGLTVGGLSDADARRLLDARHAPLDARVRDRLLAEARGNPLALLELPADGGFAAPDSIPVPQKIEQVFRTRLEALAPGERRLLILASADATGDPALFWAAARLLDVDVTRDGAGAAESGLVDFEAHVRFCHPLARSTIYHMATADERHAAHRAIAEVTDPVVDPDRRAWHRAHAGPGPDDDVAADLERSAARARARGGVPAAAAFLHRAAELTTDGARRTERVFGAVGARVEAGEPDAAAALLASLHTESLDEVEQADADVLRGRIAFVRHTDADGPRHMLRAARRLAGVDRARAREYLLDALEMAMVVGRISGVADQVVGQARDVLPAPSTPDMLEALALLTAEGHTAAVPVIRGVLADDAAWQNRPALATVLAGELWDVDAHRRITDWLIDSGEESRSPLVLRLGLAQRAVGAAQAGDFGTAIEAIAEEEAIADAAGTYPLLYARVHVAALRARRDAFDELTAAAAAATASGSGQLMANVHWAEATLHNGHGDYPAALVAARRAIEPGELYLTGIALPELVEAAIRCGDAPAATAALESLTERTSASRTPFGLGVAAYSRALVTGAEDHYVEALDHLRTSPVAPYRARAHLLYGQWLRRAGRRRDAREQLHTADDMLSSMGMDAFAHRAAEELRATGERARSRTSRAHDELTMQELHIARLVVTGATNKEIAARLYLSPRTVDAHLRNIFAKLGITSRRQLKDVPDVVSGSG